MTSKKISDNEFDSILIELMDGLTSVDILAIPGIYQILSNELRGDILMLWEGRQEAEEE